MLIDLPSLVSFLLCFSHAYPCFQLTDAAKGLCFLHSRSVIHGDLKGVCSHPEPCFTGVLTPTQPNILVDSSGTALIADFGLALVIPNPDSTLSFPRQRGHTPQWTAPEVLNDGIHSKEADIFSFAMVMVEVRRRRSVARRPSAYCRFVPIQVFTGAIPFGDGPPMMAVLAISQGRRPPRPTHPTFTTKLWTLMVRCWNQDPRLRPKALEVLKVLGDV